MVHQRFKLSKVSLSVYIGMLLLLLIALRTFLPSTIIEQYYSRGLFKVFRSVWDPVMGQSPWALFYLFWVVVIFIVARGGYQIRKIKGQQRLWYALRNIFNFIASLIIVFLIIWGFNYGRQPIDEKMTFTPYQPTLEELGVRVYQLTDSLNNLRNKISRDTLPLHKDAFPADLEDQVRSLMILALERHHYPAPGNPRLRELRPEGILLRLNTAGVYWPWVGESNIDAGLHILQKPSIMAHELGHAYGFGDEGTCTFWAWLAGRESREAHLQYAFSLAYWRRIASRYRSADPDGYMDIWRDRLSIAVRNDLQDIYENSARFKDIAPKLRHITYDTYLKMQGIQEGVLSYGKVIPLVEGYRRSQSLHSVTE